MINTSDFFGLFWGFFRKSQRRRVTMIWDSLCLIRSSFQYCFVLCISSTSKSCYLYWCFSPYLLLISNVCTQFQATSSGAIGFWSFCCWAFLYILDIQTKFFFLFTPELWKNGLDLLFLLMWNRACLDVAFILILWYNYLI